MGNITFIYLETAKFEEMKERRTDIKYIKESIHILKKQEKPIVAINSIVDIARLNADNELCKQVFQLLSGIECHCVSISYANDRVIKELAQILPTINTKSLNISGCTIDEATNMLFSAIKSTNINNLNIDQNECPEMNTKMVEILPHSKLRTLKIVSKQMDDGAATEILKVLPQTQIITLSLSSNALISDKTGEYALSMLQHTQIQDIFFTNTSMSTDMINKIKQMCDNLLSTRVCSIEMKIEEKEYMDSKYVKPGSKITQYKDWSTYIGDYLHNEKHGNGMMFFVNGDKYEGEWKHDQIHGIGTYYYNNGSKYEGELREHTMHGKGNYYYANGDKYTGEWKDDRKHGNGIYYYHDGNQYNGQWENGTKQGRGVFYYANGSRDEGKWIKDKKHGKVIYYACNGDIYEQIYEDGKQLSSKKT